MRSRLKVDDNFLSKAEKNEYCFVENVSVLPFIDRIEKIIIFKWNRTYPSDMYFDIPIKNDFWHILYKKDFKGSSHKNITMEVYGK